MISFNFQRIFKFISFCLFLQTKPEQRRVLTNETDAFINHILADWNSAGGLGVAVVRKNEQGLWNIETRGYGIATIDGGKVTEHTLFSIGSNSKLFNAIATGLLIHDETLSPRLTWTTKIASIVPFWDLQDSYAGNQTTIIDAMSHRTGLPRHDLSYKWSDTVPTIMKKMKYLRPSAEFRDIWQYNNIMYTLLGYLPELLLPSKTLIARYVKERIFEPLGMNSTTYSYEVASATGNLADGMTRQGVNFTANPFGNGTVRAKPFWSQVGGEDGNMISGAGGIISNTVDVAIWLQTLLLEGVKPGTNESIIPADVIQKLSTGVSVAAGTSPFPELSPIVYGGGLFRGPYRGHDHVWHTGSTPGFRTKISRFPSDNLGIAVLSNDEIFGDAIMEIVSARLMDEAFGLEKIDWSARFKRALPTWKFPPIPGLPPRFPHFPPGIPPSVPFTFLAGTYTNPGYGDAELCFVSWYNPTASKACKALSRSASITLPGAVKPEVSTYLAEWGSPRASHVRLTHFKGNIFNVSMLTSVPTGNASEPYWTFGDSEMDTGAYAEFVVEGSKIGFGLTGVWGAQFGVVGPQGDSVRERAEVWFDKVE